MTLTWQLEYDRGFARPGTWIVNALASGIRARLPFNRDEVLDLELRWERTHDEAPDAIYVHPSKPDCWITEPIEVTRHRIKCRIELCGAPPHIDAALKRL